jgi:hypothetical protein
MAGRFLSDAIEIMMIRHASAQQARFSPTESLPLVEVSGFPEQQLRGAHVRLTS